MDDLAVWDFAIYFTHLEAAALIVGESPTSQQCDRWKPVIDRMQIAYREAIVFHLDHFSDVEKGGVLQYVPNDGAMGIEIDPTVLQSFEMQCFSRINPADPKFKHAEFWNWLVLEANARVENQLFTRHELSKWVSAIGMRSVYQFVEFQQSQSKMPIFKWPWGDHHTVALGHLEAAARKFWVNHDPRDASTAAINKDVAAWLVNERKVSQKMAESIASILRQDDLPDGPRKKS